jgi:hypothetical protein
MQNQRLQQSTRPRNPLLRVVDLATSLARDQGWSGEYVVDYADEDGRDMVIYWHTGDGPADTAAYVVGDTLVIPTASEIEHEPLVLAADLKLTDSGRAA